MPRGPSKDKLKLQKIQRNVIKVIMVNVARDTVKAIEELDENASEKEVVKVVVGKFKDLFQEMVGVNSEHNLYGVDCFTKAVLESIGVQLDDEPDDEEEEEEEEEENDDPEDDEDLDIDV
jgi:hypothetical protein